MKTIIRLTVGWAVFLVTLSCQEKTSSPDSSLHHKDRLLLDGIMNLETRPKFAKRQLTKYLNLSSFDIRFRSRNQFVSKIMVLQALGRKEEVKMEMNRFVCPILTQSDSLILGLVDMGEYIQLNREIKW